jgi:hypothetical protein
VSADGTAQAIQSLQLQIQALQQQMQQVAAMAQGGETLQPTYLTVSPSGQVSASFSGQVNALGLILPAGIASSPPDTSRVEWRRTSDNALVADVFAYHDILLGGDHLQANVYGATNAVAEIGAIAGSSISSVTAQAQPGLASVFVQALSKTATVLDQSGNSNFLQVPSARQQTMWPQQSASVYVAPNNSQLIVFYSNGWNLGSVTSQPFFYMNAEIGNNLDHCGLEVLSVGATWIEISIANLSGVTATGTVFMMMMTGV